MIKNDDDFMNEDINRVFKNVNKNINKKPSHYANPIIGFAFIIYMICIFLFIIVSFFAKGITIGQTLDENSFEVSKIAYRYIVYEFLAFIVPILIFKAISPDSIQIKFGGFGAIIFGLLVSGSLFYPFNKSWVLKVNIFLDKSQGTTYYVKVIDKKVARITVSRNLKRDVHQIYVSSWKPDKKSIPIQVFSSEYKDFEKDQVCIIKINKGFYGLEHTDSSLKIVDATMFPEETVFPLTKSEAEKAIALKKSQSQENK